MLYKYITIENKKKYIKIKKNPQKEDLYFIKKILKTNVFRCSWKWYYISNVRNPRNIRN
jgi:hypothetical protein